MTAADLPTEILVGKADHEWPIFVFDSESGAISWLQSRNPDGRRRRVWRAKLDLAEELDLLAPEPTLVPKSQGPGR